MNLSYDDSECLSREEKVKKLSGILGVEYQIKIVQNSEINAHVKEDGIIYINTGALDNLDMEELAFTIAAHEASHIESNHIEKKKQLSKEVAHEIVQSWSGEGGFFKKISQSLLIGAYGALENIALSHSHEIEADVKAKQKLIDAGFGVKGGEKFFNRINEGFSLFHPSSEVRKNIIDKI